jgi:succinate dehydrogenase / fumarate reductase iron-sulfur subunit
MAAAMDAEGFGGCASSGECVSSCPKDIPLASIVNLNQEFLRAIREGSSRVSGTGEAPLEDRVRDGGT